MVLVASESVLGAVLARAVSEAAERVRAAAAVAGVVVGAVKSADAVRRLARIPAPRLILVAGVELAALKAACAVAVVV